MSTSGSPSSSAELCRPARSPGKAGRSRAPAARSYSNTCFQTEEERAHQLLYKNTYFSEPQQTECRRMNQ
uniref:Uncharacterized protein n=1 Tax=Oryzias sinensis TaxID=183150 RepID=A0A8C7Y9J0_9TELE